MRIDRELMMKRKVVIRKGYLESCKNFIIFPKIH